MSHIQIADDGAATLSKCQYELAQKDELITALIQELETAAEQLDRFQRSGNRSQTASATGGLSELTSAESPFMDDLKSMVQQWAESQPGSALERIESRIAEMHDLISNLQRDDRPTVDPADFDERIRRLNREPETEAVVARPPEVAAAPSWETIKNQILNAEKPPQTEASRDEDSELLKLVNETPTPKAVDFDQADLDALKQAIMERDAYIIQLNRLFRTRNTLSLPDDWATLGEVPNEMQVRVESLIAHLDVQVRLGEVEMSLERARLTRERSQIQSERENLDKHLRRLGINSIAELDNISAATGSASDRRWMRFLGPNTK